MQRSIFWKIPSPEGKGKYQLMEFWGKHLKRGREKDKNCCRKIKERGKKRKKRYRKREIGK
jgi:hypothetical protein